MEKKKDLGYIVTHTHWDREWRYPVWQYRMLLVEFMDELIKVVEEDPEYKQFVFDGQCVVIEDYLQVRPQNRGKIKGYIKEGKLLIGPWYTLPDLYPVDGECLIRNLLKGVRLSEELGACSKIGYNSFGWGQIAQFPQIYQGFGIDFAIAAKKISKARAPQSEFIWEGPDGSRLLTTRLGEHVRAIFFMNSYINIMHGQDYLTEEFYYRWGKKGILYHQADEKGYQQDYFRLEYPDEIHEDRLEKAIMKSWNGVEETTVKSHRLLMNGCDNTSPQPMLSEIVRKANAVFEDKEFKLSTLQEYVEKLKELVDYDSLAVVKGEMRDGPASTVSGNALATRSYIKRLNKKAENALIFTAEPLSAIAYVLGAEYQKEFMELAMKYMLHSHPHDSINGVTQDKTADDVMYRLNQALELSEVVNNYSLQQIVKRMDFSKYDEKDIILVTFNPTPWPRRDVVKAYIDIPREYNVWEFNIEDSSGNVMETQFVSRKEEEMPVHDLNGRPWPFYTDRHCIYMDTGVIPAFGYKTYRLAPKNTFDRRAVFWGADMRKSTGEYMAISPVKMENEYLEVTVQGNGTVNILDKASGKLYENFNYYEDTGDCGDYWVHYPPYNNRTFTSLGSSARIWTTDNGPISATIAAEIVLKVPAYALRPDNEIKGESRRSDEERELKITTFYTLKKGSKKLDVKVVTDNTAEDHRLRVMFDTGIKSELSYAAGHFNVDKRPVSPVRDKTGEYYPEMQTLPHQIFVDISDGNDGMAFISNCLVEFEAMDNKDRTLALTLFRSTRVSMITDYYIAGKFPEQKGSQSPGIQEYEYSIHPHKGYWMDAGVYREAKEFNLPVRLIQTSRNEGTLPLEQGFLSIEPGNLVMSAFKKAEDRDSFILRAFNPTDGLLAGKVWFYGDIKEAYLTDLNENRIRELKVEDGHAVHIEAESCKIVTVEIALGGR